MSGNAQVQLAVFFRSQVKLGHISAAECCSVSFTDPFARIITNLSQKEPQTKEQLKEEFEYLTKSSSIFSAAQTQLKLMLDDPSSDEIVFNIEVDRMQVDHHIEKFQVLMEMLRIPASSGRMLSFDDQDSSDDETTALEGLSDARVDNADCTNMINRLLLGECLIASELSSLVSLPGPIVSNLVIIRLIRIVVEVTTRTCKFIAG